MNVLSKVLEIMRQRRNTKETLRILHSMSDYDLKDIGITRCEIDGVARGILDVHRAARDARAALVPKKEHPGYLTGKDKT